MGEERGGKERERDGGREGKRERERDRGWPRWCHAGTKVFRQLRQFAEHGQARLRPAGSDKLSSWQVDEVIVKRVSRSSSAPLVLVNAIYNTHLFFLEFSFRVEVAVLGCPS